MIPTLCRRTLLGATAALAGRLRSSVARAGAALAAPVDRRLLEQRDPYTRYSFTPYASRAAWLARAQVLRGQVLAAAGLLPLPPRPPLNAHIFGKIDRDGYSVEKVWFESHPGFYVTGNLYRPRGRPGRHPAIVNMHGHWKYGRLEDSKDCSVPGRAINMALQGHVAFSFDMVGYNDSKQLTHQFGAGRREELWGLSLGGLQLWNSIRAVDFVCSLPDVDPDRIGATGASGGGTQTYLLMAADERVKVGAPVNMISAHMQGDCLCEGMPGLRIDTNNLELAALAAPRPLLMVSCTQDWTAETPTVEYPAVRSIYRLFAAEDRLRSVHLDAPHNYNQQSREAAYAWFGRWLLGDADEAHFKEKPFKVEPLSDLLVFYGKEPPPSAMGPEGLTSYWIGACREQIDSFRLERRQDVEHLKQELGPALERSLALTVPEARDIEVEPGVQTIAGTMKREDIVLGRREKGERIPATLWKGPGGHGIGTVLVHDKGRAAFLSTNGRPGTLITALAERGPVLAVDAFQTGGATGKVKPGHFFTIYNRTEDANRIQDIVTVSICLQKLGVKVVNLVGAGPAGLWVLLARGFVPHLGRTVADADGFANDSDAAFVDGLFSPGLRRAGEFRTAAALSGSAPLLVHSTGGRFVTGGIASVYRALAATSAFEAQNEAATDAQIVSWLAR